MESGKSYTKVKLAVSALFLMILITLMILLTSSNSPVWANFNMDQVLSCAQRLVEMSAKLVWSG